MINKTAFIYNTVYNKNIMYYSYFQHILSVNNNMCFLFTAIHKFRVSKTLILLYYSGGCSEWIKSNDIY